MDVESATKTVYIKSSGLKKSKNKAKGSGIRAMKSQGTSKIYIVTAHYGHDISLGHLRIAKQER